MPTKLKKLQGEVPSSGGARARDFGGQYKRSIPSFLTLWQGFLTGRTIVALALLVLQVIHQILNHNAPSLVLWVGVFYVGATLALRWLAGQTMPSPEVGVHWLPSIGVDLAVISTLQYLQIGGLSFIPLFGLPILMASVLGTLTLAMGTTAAVTLLLLASAWWLGDSSGGDMAQRSLQAALTSTGYFIGALLMHQLAVRLAREQRLAESSRLTARMQSEVSALVIQHLTEGVLVVDEDFEVRAANPAGLMLLAGDAGQELPFSLQSRPSWIPLAALARKTFRQSAVQVADVNLIADNLSPIGLHVRTWLTAGKVRPGDKPMARQCVMFLHDLREMEARLRTEKLAAMGRMSAAVAHEIRNPLAAIVQANALLDEDLQDPAHKRLTKMVDQNAERLNRIAEEILDLARVQNQIGHASAATVALDEAVGQIFEDWQQQAPAERKAALRLNAGVMQVEFDKDHLRRVLVNLLDNALRYRSNASESLQVLTRADGQGQAHMVVWSDGAPLDQSVERHLFEPFFSSESRSSGLGLYICRGLCERHGASIHYRRTLRDLAGAERTGNAFTVRFRATGLVPIESANLFGAIV